VDKREYMIQMGEDAHSRGEKIEGWGGARSIQGSN